MKFFASSLLYVVLWELKIQQTNNIYKQWKNKNKKQWNNKKMWNQKNVKIQGKSKIQKTQKSKMAQPKIKKWESKIKLRMKKFKN